MKLVLCALWISMMFVFAYGDIFGFFRSDVLKAALDGKVATTGWEVNQVSLTFTLIYILLAVLMVVPSLLLTPQLHQVILLVAIARATGTWHVVQAARARSRSASRSASLMSLRSP